MNRQKWMILVVALAMIGGAVGALGYLRSHQKLGRPGVKTSPLPGSIRLQVELPKKVLNYTSEPIDMDKVTLGYLPTDTSFGQRLYQAPDGLSLQVTVVLMGSDRTSLHKPQLCLGGQGWRIDDARSSEEKIHIERPQPYDLPVMKLMTTRQNREGPRGDERLVYVYWFVADGELTAQHSQRMWWMMRDLVRTGVLQRWAYVICAATCGPGQEEATYNRIKQFIAAAVPDFQLAPSPATAAVAARQ